MNAGENTETAHSILQQVLEEAKPENKFQISMCPRCGTKIIPDKKGALECYGVDVTEKEFRLFCPDKKCI